jgi:hypothetical protein
MAASRMLQKRNSLFLIILFVAVSIFTADIIDLREELRFLSYPYSNLDSGITDGVACPFAVAPVPRISRSPVEGKTSVKISFIHLLPYGFRAPPSLS